VLREGTGATPAEEDGFEIEWVLWSAEGDLIERSRPEGGQIQGRKADMGLAVLKEAPFLMKEGGEYLFEVPSSLAWGNRAVGKVPAGATTIWRMRMVRVNKPRPVPDFVLPPEAELKRTPSGLGIKVLREGAGAAPKMGEQVVVHYAGWLADSKPGEAQPFDASYGRGAPMAFRLGEVVEGWNEGLQHLKPGGEAILVIPARLGYGDRGAGTRIPPGATLVFRVELLEVKK
jgi:FKBP-type peptidyl-prolyl cis-trans isomerase